MSDSIKLTDAAKYYAAEPHQKAAWEWLEETMGVHVNQEFAKRYRDKPELVKPTKIGDKGLALIKEFEGCRLTAYYCPAGILTIGVGHTGPDVYAGQMISQAEADELLRKDVDRFEKAVAKLIEVSLDQSEFDALTSFAFNCGEGALRDSTLRRRLNNGESKPKVFAEELPRWTSGGMAGLVRRRDAEVKLANLKLYP